jgi:hypothetical protein
VIAAVRARERGALIVERERASVVERLDVRDA